ncbi:hypothetical protein B0T16DRAFT_420977 [Cercophora newfieldiana]|uniref:Uncharacterized protein n=1 Tax=Cercophora newfieldiana TaxID=92897 RepID=A0AA40CLQ5_9PEZI|nr:hypothetical protein B0T16DRAFT_420977 [Cercophora newfieldiana]
MCLAGVGLRTGRQARTQGKKGDLVAGIGGARDKIMLALSRGRGACSPPAGPYVLALSLADPVGCSLGSCPGPLRVSLVVVVVGGRAAVGNGACCVQPCVARVETEVELSPSCENLSLCEMDAADNRVRGNPRVAKLPTLAGEASLRAVVCLLGFRDVALHQTATCEESSPLSVKLCVGKPSFLATKTQNFRLYLACISSSDRLLLDSGEENGSGHGADRCRAEMRRFHVSGRIDFRNMTELGRRAWTCGRHRRREGRTCWLVPLRCPPARPYAPAPSGWACIDGDGGGGVRVSCGA